MWSKFAEVQCAFAVAEVRKVTANLLQTCRFAEHLLQFCGCGIECKFAVPSSEGNDTTDEQARMGVLLVPSAIPCSLSSPISCIHFYL